MAVSVGFTKKSVKGYCNYPKHLDALKKAEINQIELPTTFDRKPSKIIDTLNYYWKDFKKILLTSYIVMQQTPPGLHSSLED